MLLGFFYLLGQLPGLNEIIFREKIIKALYFKNIQRRLVTAGHVTL